MLADYDDVQRFKHLCVFLLDKVKIIDRRNIKDFQIEYLPIVHNLFMEIVRHFLITYIMPDYDLYGDKELSCRLYCSIDSSTALTQHCFIVWRMGNKLYRMAGFMSTSSAYSNDDIIHVSLSEEAAKGRLKYADVYIANNKYDTFNFETKPVDLGDSTVSLYYYEISQGGDITYVRGDMLFELINSSTSFTFIAYRFNKNNPFSGVEIYRKTIYDKFLINYLQKQELRYIIVFNNKEKLIVNYESPHFTIDIDKGTVVKYRTEYSISFKESTRNISLVLASTEGKSYKMLILTKEGYYKSIDVPDKYKDVLIDISEYAAKSRQQFMISPKADNTIIVLEFELIGVRSSVVYLIKVSDWRVSDVKRIDEVYYSDVSRGEACCFFIQRKSDSEYHLYFIDLNHNILHEIVLDYQSFYGIMANYGAHLPTTWCLNGLAIILSFRNIRYLAIDYRNPDNILHYLGTVLYKKDYDAIIYIPEVRLFVAIVGENLRRKVYVIKDNGLRFPSEATSEEVISKIDVYRNKFALGKYDVLLSFSFLRAEFTVSINQFVVYRYRFFDKSMSLL